MSTRMHSVPVCCMSVGKSRCTWWRNFSHRLQQLRRSTTAPNLCRLTRSRQAITTSASNRRPRNPMIGRLCISKFYQRPATKSIVPNSPHLTPLQKIYLSLSTLQLFLRGATLSTTSLAIMMFRSRLSSVQSNDVFRSACTHNRDGFRGKYWWGKTKSRRPFSRRLQNAGQNYQINHSTPPKNAPCITVCWLYYCTAATGGKA